MQNTTEIETGLVDGEQELDKYQPTLKVHLKRGECGHVWKLVYLFVFFFLLLSHLYFAQRFFCFVQLVSDFRRRKIIEVFELHDTELKGALEIEHVIKMSIPDKFHASAALRRSAQDFVKDKTQLSLKEFIHYCSLLIHPLLLEFHFKCGVAKLGAKVEIRDGPLPSVHTECYGSVLVAMNFKQEQPKEGAFQDDSEHEKDEESSFEDNEDDDTLKKSKRPKLIGIWLPKQNDKSENNLNTGAK
ncbi:hypothetical protein RFI_04465 [Reticulomyxa filosa]|uniref:Uncharacterized protein n=1 Tax=Reticulomyxa filosa TaxID=46433 RepID=X6P4Y7_RETFI|nr:hypothetical protein RFI_04465 [Reticulomyxa filosa]|eukprot:ETO32652.1 hypothetical protein RFI_04465 [Reticulomyxa filosa]